MTGQANTIGILSCAAYLPRWRLSRETVHAASGWAAGMGKASSGQRSFAHWDEDSITMGVEAARNALSPLDRDAAGIRAVSLVSTSLPFADRSNAGLLREATQLEPSVAVRDITGSRKSAVGELSALAVSGSGPHLLVASDAVDALPASDAELTTGHGAVALVYGEGKPIATLLGSVSLQQDLIDQYRMFDQRFSYQLESRWNREAGVRPQVRQLAASLLEQAGCQPAEISWLLIPVDASLNRSLKKDCRMDQAKTAETLTQNLGLCGAAHPLLMLAWALEQADDGDLVILAGLGQGCELVLLQVKGSRAERANGFQSLLDSGRLEDNYTRYLGMRRLLSLDSGIRGERDNRTSQSAYFRRHRDINGFFGGLCSACGKLQFPNSSLCVHCHASETQEPHSLAGMVGEINSFTEDWLAYSPRPPLMFGNVHFPGGANVMMEFSDFLPGELETGQSVRMSFRIKEFDSRRNFRRYFWKPTPITGAIA